jgi:uncharacterized Zn-finger protein
MSDRDGKIWMDGQMVDWRDAKIHVLSHTLHYGCGAFEGVRAYNTAHGTAIFRLQEHTERLFNSAKILRMKIPFTPEQVMQAQCDVVRENKLESCYLRPLVWIGDQKLGVSPKGNTIHLMVAAWPWGAYLGEEGLARGIRVKTSSYTRHHVNITMTQAKAVSNYTNSILANMEATDEGYDEALLLDGRLRQRRRGREPVRHQEGRGLHARPVGRRAQRHHPRHHLQHLQRPGPDAGGKAHHARRGLHLRRGLLHRHRRRGDADPRARPHRTRPRQPRPDHREDPGGLLRHRQRPQPQVRRVADQRSETRIRRRPLIHTAPGRAMSTSQVAVVEVTAQDVQGPGVVACPNPKMALWSTHPKVFIDVATTGEASAPTAARSTGLKAGETCCRRSG